jgi:DNA-binding NarL/FixJ family response regulator
MKSSGRSTMTTMNTIPSTAARPIRILVIDDHPLFREGLARTLGEEEGFEIVGQVEDGAAAEEAWTRFGPDVALVDVSMPGIDGIETVRRLVARDPAAKLLMLTSSEDSGDVIAALDAGASGYVTKTVRYGDLVAAVREVHAGGRPLGELIARKVAARNRDSPLTPRELDVLKLLREGLSLDDLARRLAITERTVRAHVTAIKVKLDAANTAQAVARGFELGLLAARAAQART